MGEVPTTNLFITMMYKYPNSSFKKTQNDIVKINFAFVLSLSMKVFFWAVARALCWSLLVGLGLEG